MTEEQEQEQGEIEIVKETNEMRGDDEPIKRDKEIDKEWKTESYMQIESERAGR